MANKTYIDRLIQVICHLHKSDAKHVESVPVAETFEGRTIWKGTVEVFSLANHPKAKRAFAWSHKAGENDSDERFVAVLELPPVTSPETAVKVAIASEIKKKR